jgi:AraC family transcriptional regulator
VLLAWKRYFGATAHAIKRAFSRHAKVAACERDEWRSMDPIQKALWYIEGHFEGELSVEDIARAADVSRFHLARMFSLSLGLSPMAYARARRLTQAARALASGAPDILAVALAHGYGSHEAFTRAFRDQFGATPEQVRAKGALDGLNLQEPIRMNTQTKANLAAPRFEAGRALLIAGLSARYRQGGDPAIPSQWQRFAPHLGRVPGQVGDVAYGVCANFDNDGAFDYMCGVEVTRFSDLPRDFASIRIPEQRYAVFTHSGHIAAITSTFGAIFGQWVPSSGHKAADAPMFERYDDRFDARTGNGEVEIWLPLA